MRGAMLVLCGLAILIAGLALRFNPLLVVTLAGLATGLAAGLGPLAVVAAVGKAFVDNRFMAIAWLVLPVIGLLEGGGLKEQARHLVSRLRNASAGRILMVYFLCRQITAALGLTSLGGHVQMVRPLVAPMAQAAAERQHPLDEAGRQLMRAHAAAAENIALFFGEDVFIAIGSILLIRGFLAQNGIDVLPPRLALWATPTAVLAFAVHGARLWWLDRRIAAKANL